ncbi:hypothetical protein DDE18_06640 [Nocardioides gansuensis]|uniref:Glycosyl transferase family 1 domain-containing protein n=1 Tax=Nocardioides gansuensis TaxID=2138300 RepID=A0A2T8FE09_9ACTN|nr:glycosyltransferase [Nocardioides gansuensis]PVG83951.1 hypothetical protein DDE18_06640 [Nocardioides gansuensis]
MITSVSSGVVIDALTQRLSVATVALTGVQPEISGADAADTTSQALVHLAGEVEATPGPDIWLFLTAVCGRFPMAGEVQRAARILQLDGPEALASNALDNVAADPVSARPDLPIDIITDRAVVYADYCARHDNNSGIQRVTRAVAQRWAVWHDAVAVADTEERSGFRTLSPQEELRVCSFGLDTEVDHELEAAFSPRLIVPWRTTVLFPEVPHWHAARTTRELVAYSGNRACAVGHDMIPVVSASLRPQQESVFTLYLSSVKHMAKVATVSNSARDEFRGFTHMLSAQGLAGPRVETVMLPEDLGRPERPLQSQPPTRPRVVVPARQEIHKNVLMVVQAAHRLWSEGQDFELVLMGGDGLAKPLIRQAVAAIESEGHPITSLGWVSDDEMWQQLVDASFAVFVSLHEGYGLPVVEALACGTPVLTSNYGSQAEIAAHGGCVTVDPRDMDAVAAAMRELITCPERLVELRAEIDKRASRTWDDYARDLWEFTTDHGGGNQEVGR